MKIKAWDYKTEYENEKAEIHAAIEEVFNSGQLILGEKVRQFENAYAGFCEVKYGVGVDNGTNAIFLALKALGIKENDEVITVSYTAIPTVSAIVTAGAKPVFADIEESTMLLDTSKIEGLITSKTRCIIPVHLYGQCVDMDEINSIALKYNLKVLEDCAQSHGALYKNRKAGSFSDIAATSFYPTKTLGACGDAGMVLTSNEDYYRKLMRLRMYGMEGKEYYALEHGYNCRLDEIQAAILLKKFSHISSYISKRRDIAQKYHDALKGSSLTLPIEKSYGVHSYHQYAVRHPERKMILEALAKKDVFLSIHYEYPVHMMEGYKFLGYNTGSLPVTEKAAQEVFSLPVYPSMTNQMQQYIIETILDVMAKHGL